MPPLTPGRRWRCNSPWIPFRWPSTRRRAGGYDRIMRLTEAWHDVRAEYSAVMNPGNPDADVMQEHMDRVMVQIINGRQPLKPFASRYPELMKVTYGGKKWK